MKKTPHQWADFYGIQIMDPDGWRMDDMSFLTPIDFEDFYTRTMISTIQVLDKKKFDEMSRFYEFYRGG